MDSIVPRVPQGRSAGLDGAERISIPPQASPEQAWSLILEGTGVGDERLAQCVAAHFGLDAADTANVSSGTARRHEKRGLGHLV